MSIYSERLDKIKSVLLEPMTIEEITQRSGIGERQVRDVIARAISRGGLVNVGKRSAYSLYDLPASVKRPKKT
jgi:DNA-binding transcriptional regulator PaaX